MEDKKLDTLFQEKLANLEVTPNEKVWGAILEKRNKKKRRIVPLWWFSGGVAAVLILGLLLFPLSGKEDSKNNTIDNIIVIDDSKNNIKDIIPTKEGIDSIIISPEEKNQQKILVTENKSTPNKNIETKNKKHLPSKKTNFLVAENTQNLIEKEKVNLVDKNAMEKIFLIDTIQNKNDKKSDLKADKKVDSITSKDLKLKKEEILKPKKDFIAAVEKQEKKEDDLVEKTWSITPVVAVLNSNSFSNTSPIDKNLSETTQGNNSFSFGVQVAYEVSDKWTIQTGVHMQEMAFSNTDVAVVASTPTNSSSMSLATNENYSLQSMSSRSFETSSVMLSEVRSFNGNVLQKYGYLEVPVEVKYKFLNKNKLNTQIVAGFSSLFLNKNEIDVNSNSFTTSGKANNLNTVNFSGNLGLDIEYNFDKKWAFRLNPMIKTQLNTFNQNANNFKPYFIGIYSGISYRF